MLLHQSEDTWRPRSYFFDKALSRLSAKVTEHLVQVEVWSHQRLVCKVCFHGVGGLARLEPCNMEVDGIIVHVQALESQLV